MTTENPAAQSNEPDFVEPIDSELDSQETAEGTAEGGRYRDPVTGKFAKRPDEESDNPFILQKMPDLREKIAEKFNAARKEIEAETSQEEPTARIRTEDEKAAEEAEGGEQVLPEPEAKVKPQPDAVAPSGPVPLTIVVDGHVYHVDRNDARWSAQGMTDDMVRASAQMYWAAQARLQKANQALDSTGRGKSADQSGGAAQPASQASSETKLDAEKIGEIVDRLQLGNRDEAGEALKELVDLVQTRQAQPQPDLQVEVRQALVQQENQREIERAIAKFEQENPDLASDKYLSQSVINMAVDTMIDDMKAVGVTDQMLAPVVGRPEIIAGIYRNMRSDGRFPLKSYDEVLAKAADLLRTRYNRPRAQNTAPTQNQAAQQRLQQKRQMQQQPRSAGVKGAQGQPPRPQTSTEVVRDMRRQRMPWLGH